jgi:hypothetical protein
VCKNIPLSIGRVLKLRVPEFGVRAEEMRKGFFLLVAGLTASADQLHPGLAGFAEPLLKKDFDIAVSAHLNHQIQQLIQFANGICRSALPGRRVLLASPWIAFRGPFHHLTLSSFHGYSPIPVHVIHLFPGESTKIHSLACS